jgi:hypothetical protein
MLSQLETGPGRAKVWLYRHNYTQQPYSFANAETPSIRVVQESHQLAIPAKSSSNPVTLPAL